VARSASKAGHRHAERRQDDDVLRVHGGEVERAVRVGHEDLDPHAPEFRVDVRVVDDLANEQQPPIGELPARLIGVLHRALHPVAESELAREADRDVPRR
jgi:hypothetical protein